MFEIAFFSVLLIDVLGGSVHGDDESVESGFDGFSGVIVVEEVGVGGGDGVYTFLVGVLDHFEEFGIDIRFALEVEDEVH